MLSSPDLTSEEGLRNYLGANNLPKSVSVTLLSGGSANYVYRVSGIDGTTRIFKHAAPYLHSNKNFTLDPTRMDYEALALNKFSNGHSESSLSIPIASQTVKAVGLISYDEKHKLLCIEDGGSRNLKDAYDDPELDIPQIGQELAKWIAAMHISSKDISLALPTQEDQLKRNNPIAVAIYRHSYMNLHAALSQYGHDTKLAEKINEGYGSLLSIDDECVCHGDFWPGNVLVRIHEAPGQPADLTIVDWEIVRRGTSATDVGQFAAEAFLLDQFRGARGLLAAFLNTYAEIRQHDTMLINKAWIKRMIVHWAVHIAFWPTRVTWTDREGTQQLVDIGVGALKDVLDDDWEKLLESPLLKDGKEVWTSILRRC